MIRYGKLYTVESVTLFLKMCQLKDSVFPLACHIFWNMKCMCDWGVLVLCGVQVKQAHCPMVLWLMGALRASLEHTTELTMLSLQRDTLKAKTLPFTPSSIMKMTLVSTKSPNIIIYSCYNELFPCWQILDSSILYEMALQKLLASAEINFYILKLWKAVFICMSCSLLPFSISGHNVASATRK